LDADYLGSSNDIKYCSGGRNITNWDVTFMRALDTGDTKNIVLFNYLNDKFKILD